VRECAKPCKDKFTQQFSLPEIERAWFSRFCLKNGFLSLGISAKALGIAEPDAKSAKIVWFIAYDKLKSECSEKPPSTR
jgi:hypothetical protein